VENILYVILAEPLEGGVVGVESSEGQRTWQWMEVVKEASMSDHIETYSTPVLDPRELHIEQIFSPNRFDVLTILKALNVSNSIHTVV